MSQVIFFLKLVILLLILSSFSILLFLSKKKEERYFKEVIEYEFKLPVLASIGFYLLEKINFKLPLGYERNIRNKLAELYGYKKAGIFLRVHMAQKISLSIVSLLFGAIIFLNSDSNGSALILIILITILINYWLDKELDVKSAKRKNEILTDLPVFINTVVLLVNAGLPFNAAIEKAAKDKPSRFLYKEVNYLLADINAGKPMKQAYEELAHRCRIPEITRFVSAVLQNLNRGTGDLVFVLHRLSSESWDKRKDVARKRGEEAAAKLVFPMAMVFLAVSIIILAPAIISMIR